MTKKGYEWDAEKKELKKIEQKPIEMKSAEESLGVDSDTYNEIVDECIYGEQKPAEYCINGNLEEARKQYNEYLYNGDYKQAVKLERLFPTLKEEEKSKTYYCLMGGECDNDCQFRYKGCKWRTTDKNKSGGILSDDDD